MAINKKIIFQEYLIKRIGYLEDEFLNEYLSRLDLRQSQNRKFSIVSLLLYEYKNKKEFKPKLKQFIGSSISATDLSNFTYCVASYSISKTFELPKLESAEKGTEQHEISPITNSFQYSIYDRPEKKEATTFWFDRYSNKENSFFFKDLSNSTLMFHGHNKHEAEKGRTFFKSAKGNYVGQPDYIFKNSDGTFFVIEEKFQHQDYAIDGNMSFHLNHLNQTISYLHGISDFDIQYGYLVYWKYNFDYEGLNIHSCYVRKIIKSEATRSHISSVFVELKKFKTLGITDFNVSKRNVSKCFNCVVTAFCGHKTGNFNKVEIPYSTKYWKLKYTPFPEELKKDTGPDVNPSPVQ